MSVTKYLELAAVSVQQPTTGRSLLARLNCQFCAGEFIVVTSVPETTAALLLRLINRLELPSQGHISWAKQPIQHSQAHLWRRQAVLVAAQPNLLGLSAREAIAYPLNLQQLPSTELQQRLTTWAKAFNLNETHLDSMAATLTVNWQQHVAIARACAMQPQLLLLDSPLAVLETDAEQQHVLEILQAQTFKRRLLIVVATQTPWLFRRHATRLIQFEQGQRIKDEAIERVDWQALQENLQQRNAAIASDWDLD
ncbi:MAG: ATP-binding cassette domain-containing protein [Cyanobacteria bacterium P01_H01_bin.121]